jgi:hypothetical protein
MYQRMMENGASARSAYERYLGGLRTGLIGGIYRSIGRGRVETDVIAMLDQLKLSISIEGG